MSRLSVIGWSRLVNPSPRGRRTTAPASARTVFRLEALEDRSLPSTFTVTNLRDDGSPGGGAILNEAAATLVLDHDALTGNQASTNVGSDVLGGGLLNLGSATVTQTTFTGNKAVGGGSGSFFGGSVGGGIANSAGA